MSCDSCSTATRSDTFFFILLPFTGQVASTVSTVVQQTPHACACPAAAFVYRTSFWVWFRPSQYFVNTMPFNCIVRRSRLIFTLNQHPSWCSWITALAYSSSPFDRRRDALREARQSTAIFPLSVPNHLPPKGIGPHRLNTTLAVQPSFTHFLAHRGPCALSTAPSVARSNIVAPFMSTTSASAPLLT